MQTFIGIGFDAFHTATVTSAIAVGFFVVLSVMRVYNMAYGEFVMMGAYSAAYSFANGYSWLGAGIGTLFICTVFALLLEIPLNHVRRQEQSSGLLLTWGISVGLIQATRIVLGPSGVSVDIPPLPPLVIAGAVVPTYNLIVSGAACLMLLVVVALWNLGPTASILSAVRDNSLAAELLGIDTRAVCRATFVFSAVFAGLLGVLLSPISAVTPSLGSAYTMIAVLTVLSFGATSLSKVILAAALLSLVRSVIAFMFNPALATAGMFLCVCLILATRSVFQGERECAEY